MFNYFEYKDLVISDLIDIVVGNYLTEDVKIILNLFLGIDFFKSILFGFYQI